MCVCSHARSSSSSKLWRWTTELAHRWPYLVFVGLWLIASDGWAQGPLRRLGGRVREAIQSGGPLAPPVAPAPQGQAAPGQAAQAPSAAPGSQARFPALRPGATAGARASESAGTRASAAAGARPTGPSANYQRAASTAAAQSNLPARSNLPAASRPDAAAMSNRLPQPTYAAPASSRAGSSNRQANSFAATAGGEALDLEVAKLGLKVSDETLATVNHQSSRAPRGVLVTAVLVGSGGDAAGLKSGDRLLAVNGRLVNQAEPLVDMVDQIAPGEPIELKFNREGKLHSTVGLASGPTGKLDQEEFAIVRQQAREMMGELAATQGELPAANGTTGESGSALGGIGSVLGSWLGSSAGKASPAASDLDPSVPVASEPNARDVDAAETTDSAKAKGNGYKSLRPSVGVLSAPGVADSDPPSLEGELGPDASGDSAVEVAETLPAPRPADDENATVNQLLKEIRLLRERVQQLEAQKASEVR